MADLRLYFLGSPRVELAGALVDLQRRKALALLVYLAVSGQPHSRDALATLFWPELDQQRGRAYLRRDLASLNTSLPGNWLIADRETVELNREAGLWLDTEQFQHLLTAGQAHSHAPEVVCPECIPLLTKAAALYNGDFLAGFTLRDSPEFDDWQFFQTESLRQQLAAILERLVRGLMSQGKADTAIPYARRWVALDPLYEPAQRQLIQAYDQAGQPAAGLRQYEEYVKLLEEELGLPPEEETTTLYEAVKAKRLLGAFLKAELPPDQAPAKTQPPPKAVSSPSPRQEIRFCTTSTQVRIAYATVGNGPPLVKAANWLSHLEYDWNSPVWRHWLLGLSQQHTLVRYDRRGCGLSDWQVDDFSLPAHLEDLETVVDTLGLERFPLFGLSGGGPVAIAYAVRHPERVSHLILYGSYGRGRLKRSQNPQQLEEVQMMLKMIELGWGKPNPAFRQIYTSLFIPEGTPEQINWVNDLQRVSTSPEMAVRMFSATYVTDVSDLARQVTVPTLILHARADAVVPFEEGRQLAALIPGARFVSLEGKNHILLADEPVWPRFLAEVYQFIQTEYVPPIVPSRATPLPSSTLAQPPDIFKHLPHHNLPTQLTEFIGREKEVAEIGRMLIEESNCRLLTLVGPGGIGKTRLALAVGASLIAHFSEGVYFVPLASISEAGYIVSAIAEALNFKFASGSDATTQLLNHLCPRQLLLILDNFEHVVQGATWLLDILAGAVQVKLLITSQERLNLQEEWSYEVEQLGFPQPTEPLPTPAEIRHYSAVDLFVQRAQRASARFRLTSADMPHVARICQLVGGMPLALELAAPWIRLMNCQEIAAEIERNLDFLSTPAMRNIPERHRSLRAIFEQTWQRLLPEEQTALSRLAVFRSGCTRKAAEVVAEASLSLLASLADKALLRRQRNDRFEMHELIRHFALEQLQTSPAEYEQMCDRHAAYYGSFVAQQDAGLEGPEQGEALIRIGVDLDNVRAAWRWAVTRPDLQMLNQAAQGLWCYAFIRGTFEEGKNAFHQAAAALQMGVSLTENQKYLVGFFQAAEGYLSALGGQVAEGISLMQQGLAVIRQADHTDERKEAYSLFRLSMILARLGKFAEAEAAAQQSRQLFNNVGNQWGIAVSTWILGVVALWHGRLADATQLLEACLALTGHAGNPLVVTHVNEELAQAAIICGQYSQAKQHLEDSLRISQAIGYRTGQIYALRGLGNVAISQGEYELAVKHIQTGLTIAQEAGNDWDVGSTRSYLAAALQAQGEYAEAEHLYQQSLSAARKVGHPGYVGICLRGLGALAYNQEQYVQADQYLQEALAVWQQLDNEAEIASVQCLWGYIRVAEGRVTEAGAYFKAALTLAARHHVAPVALDIFVGVANLLSQQEEYTYAVELLALAQHHPASTFETKDRARQHLLDLSNGKPPEEIDATKTRGAVLDWQTVAQQLGAVLSVTNGDKLYRPTSVLHPDITGGRFLLQELIASGGMGQVYLGYDTQTGQPVAIKRLKPELVAHHPEAVQRLIREGDILRQLNHPNIVKVLATLANEAEPIIVMEYIPGGSLKDLLDRQPQLPLDQALHLSLELADALARVHHLGILHRDLKPANILLATDGTPRLTDFGVAYLAQTESKLTQEGAILGTTVYLSPEAWRGEPLDARSDIWSFGAVLYEMLTGRPPFAAEHAVAVMTSILNDPVPDLLQFRPDAPPALITLIKHMLVKERELRLDSMRQVAAGLEVIHRSMTNLS